MPQWLSDLIAINPWLGLNVLIIVGVALAWKYLKPPTKGLNHFLEDWNGEPDRQGVTGRPGVMKRLQDIDASGSKTDSWMEKYGPIIDKLDHEMHPNSGSSMADAVNRTEKALSDHLAACPVTPPAQTTVTVNTGTQTQGEQA
jgi:hypothetical protein